MFTSLERNAFYRIGTAFLWFLVIIALPITSFPLLSQITGAIVAPLSAIPLALLLNTWFVPYLLGKGKIPAEFVPLLYFVLIALILSSTAFFLDGYYDRNRDFFDQSLRAFITLAIGLSFYLLFSTYPNSETRVAQTLKWITIMGAILIPWTLTEVVLLRMYDLVIGFPDWVMKIRSALAVQSPNVAYTNRVTGFAYEPSWFVRIFSLVLFPIWLSAVFQRKSLFRLKLWVFQLEDLLLAASLVVFGFSSPRIGLLAFLASLAYLIILMLQRFNRWFTAWIVKRRKRPPKHIIWVKVLLAAIILLIVFVMITGALMAYITAASSWDLRFELLLVQFSLDKIKIFPLSESRLIYLARDLAFFERVIYWFGGWHIFNDYPFGVGLGNAGFYFFDRIHNAGMESFELRNLAYRANYLANTKNMWTRLLSETGFIGLIIILIWLLVLWRSAKLTRKSHSDIMQILGLAGQLFLLANLFEFFSMDSFAMPDQWVMAGLISAGGFLVRKELTAKDKHQRSTSDPD